MQFLAPRHRDLTDEEEEAIIALKSEHWPYERSSQQQWMRSHVDASDMHCLCRQNGRACAYLRLVFREARQEAAAFAAFGVGTVIVAKDLQGTGLGRFLMTRTAETARSNGAEVGFLFCSENLIPFYAGTGWSEFPAPVLQFGAEDDGEIFSPQPTAMTFDPHMKLGAGPVHLAGAPF
ncbi:MAG: GNAT family N-acetyltransferase [Rhodospirillales bacterium]